MDLVDSATGTTTVAGPKGARNVESKVIGLIDIAAVRRGHAQRGETCEIAGVGPVPVSTLRNLLGEAFFALVLHDGVDILNVTHVGRQVTAFQRTALEARGYVCGIEGCGVTWGLEIDHLGEGWAVTKTTCLDELDWKCGHCHDLKTYRGWKDEGPPGRRRWTYQPTADRPPGDLFGDTPAA